MFRNFNNDSLNILKIHNSRPSGYGVSLLVKPKLENMIIAVERMFPKKGSLGTRLKEMA